MYKRQGSDILEQMKKDLRLNSIPVFMECFDNSNIQGTDPVASCVVFKNAKPFKSEYKHFNIKTVEGPDDFATMEEAVSYTHLDVYKRQIDGHAPGLKGKDLMKYYNSGISTDHEALNYHEALEKIKLGMIIQIREGSASKHFDELCPLIDKYPDRVMLCSDDLHPEDLIKGHIQLLSLIHI